MLWVVTATTTSVTVDELLTIVNVALGNKDVSACDVDDANRDGQITINEILSAVSNAWVRPVDADSHERSDSDPDSQSLSDCGTIRWTGAANFHAMHRANGQRYRYASGCDCNAGGRVQQPLDTARNAAVALRNAVAALPKRG